MKRQDAVLNQIIQQETQLLIRTDPMDVLGDLIDDEFAEIGSSRASRLLLYLPLNSRL